MMEFEQPSGETSEIGSGVAPTGSAPSGDTSSAAAPQLYEVKIDGQTQKVPLDELLKGYQRHSTFTRKTQEFSTKEAQYQRELAEHRAAIAEAKAFLLDKEKVRQYYERLSGQPLSQQQQELAEAGEAAGLSRAEIQQLLQQQQQRFEQGLMQLQQKLELDRAAAGFRGQVDHFIGQLLEKHPELRAIPRAGERLKGAVREREPKSLEETFALLQEEAQGLAEGIRSFATKAAPSPAPGNPALSRGIEPPSNGAPPPKQEQVFKSVTDPRLREAVMADLAKIMGPS